jgi:hypothetical protein
VGVSGRVECRGLLEVIVVDRLVAFGGRVEDQGHRLGREVAALDEPLLVLLAEQRAGQADRGRVVGEDPDDIRAPADLLVDAFQRVGGPQLGPVLAWQQVEAGEVFLGGFQQRADLRCDRGEAFQDVAGAAAASWALNTSLRAADTSPR